MKDWWLASWRQRLFNILGFYGVGILGFKFYDPVVQQRGGSLVVIRSLRF